MEEWRYNSPQSSAMYESKESSCPRHFISRQRVCSTIWIGRGWAPEPMWTLGWREQLLLSSGFQSRMTRISLVYWLSYNDLRRWRDGLGMSQGNNKEAKNYGVEDEIQLFSSWQQLSGNKNREFDSNTNLAFYVILNFFHSHNRSS
jgi:hypothetical protein